LEGAWQILTLSPKGDSPLPVIQMEPIELFTLAPCGAEPPVARLLSHGRDVGKVNGQEIEAQFRCRRGYVLITSDGNPTEEVAHIYLLGPDFQAVDLVWLGAM